MASPFTVGNLVGGTLVSLLGWCAAFFLNVPVVLIILLAPTAVTSMLGRLPAAPSGGGRVGEFIRDLDAALRA